MSLRIRLTLLYTILLGSILLLFGGLVYGLVSLIMIDKIDSSLQTASNDLVHLLRLNSSGQFDPHSITGYEPNANILIQVWGTNQELQVSRPTGWVDALDQNAWVTGVTNYSTNMIDELHLRVLTTPLTSERGPAGILQVGINLSLLDLVQQSLTKILIYMTSIAMLITFVITWFMTKQALNPLTTMTNIAIQITRADDLSRRIPIDNYREDEVGRLVLTFNKTLERLEKLFGSQQRFLADVSHELRTPLTVIKGNIGLIRKYGADEESLTGIESEVDRLTRMVGDLLLLNQAESGVMPLDFVKIDLGSILLEVMQQMSVLAGDRVILKLINIDQAIINGDRDRIKQVFLNLISNSISYTPKGGIVEVNLEKEGDRAIFSVKDNGAGISPEDLPHIFERFYRGDKSRTHTATSGFGLGLSIARWITEKHGGKIEVESQLKQGTTFRVYLPLHED
jgi:two-component system, OmpR family, sensor kinase